MRADRYYANVRDFGAVGDGETDDAKAIQAAIDSLPQESQSPLLYGGTIFMPGGTYRLDRQIRLPERVSLLGEHPTRVRLLGPRRLKAALLMVTGTHVQVENIQVHGGTTGIEWRGGVGSRLSNVEVRAAECPLLLRPQCEGFIRNVVLLGGDYGVRAESTGPLLLAGLTVEETRRCGIEISGGGPVLVEQFCYAGRGRALAVLGGSNVSAHSVSLSGGKGEEAVYCDAGSLLYATGISAPGYRWAIVDESGEGARLAGPDVHLYTGQATILMDPPVPRKETPLTQVRVDCGGIGCGAFEPDFGFEPGSGAYGMAYGEVVDLSKAGPDPAPAEVCRTERSGGTVAYSFPMAPGRYRVRLHMCEIYYRAANQRVFRIEISGREVAPKVDVMAETGKKFCPIVREFPDIEPQDGRIRIFMDGLDVPRFYDQGATTSATVKTAATIGGIEILPQEASQ